MNQQQFKIETQRIALEYYGLTVVFFDASKNSNYTRNEYFELLLSLTSEFTNISKEDIISPARTKNIKTARFLLIKKLRDTQVLAYTWQYIADLLNRDHATIMHAYNKLMDLIDVDKETSQLWHEYNKFLANRTIK